MWFSYLNLNQYIRFYLHVKICYKQYLFFTEIKNVLRIEINADSDANPNDPSHMTKILDKVTNISNSTTLSL